MIRFLSLEMRGWSVFCPQRRIPVHQGVTLLVGENGSGKTTFLDAIRTLLGADRFDNNRTFRDYMDQDITEAYILGRLDNSAKNRPLAKIAIKAPIGTLVCRMVKSTSTGDWARSFTICNGEFDLEHQGDVKWLNLKDYRAQLKKVGINQTMLKIISLDQGSTDSLLKRKPEELADYMLEISGDKQVVDEYNETRMGLKKAKKDFDDLYSDMEKERLKLEGLARDLKEALEYRELKGQLAKFKFDLPLAKLRDAVAKEKEALRQADSLEDEARQDEDTVRVESEDLAQKKEAYQTLTLYFNKRLEDMQLISGELVELEGEITRLGIEGGTLDTFLAEYEHIPRVSLDELGAKLKQVEQQRGDKEVAFRLVNDQLNVVQAEISRLQSEKNISYPPFVGKMRQELRAFGLDHLLLCEWVEVKDPKWRDAIEYLLGRERFTIVVDGGDHPLIAAKKIAEKERYRAYVQAPDSAARPVKTGTARAVVEVLDSRLEGCLDWLNDIRLVESVEEGHQLAKRGSITITPEAYKQDRRGGISVWDPQERHYCGRMAFEHQLTQAKAKEDQLKPLVNDAGKQLEGAKEVATAVEEEVRVQRQVLLVPERREQRDQIAAALDELAEKKNESKAQSKRAGDEVKEIQTNLGDRATEIARLGEKIEKRKQKIFENKQNADKKRSEAVEKEKEANQLRQSLKPEQRTVESDARYMDLIQTSVVLDTQIKDRQDRLGRFDETKYEAIEDRHREKESTVKDIEARVNQQSDVIEGHRQDHERLAHKYREMVKWVLEQIQDHVRKQAEACRATKAKCSFRMVSSEPPRWAIDYQVSFDGKKFVSFNNSSLSGGQKVITSLLLLIAAAKAEQTAFSFMLVDEPTAHLDLGRMEEVGQFLRDTNAQYIISIPYNANVQHMGWVDMALCFGRKQEDETLAPAITYAFAKPEYVMQRTGEMF